MSIKEFNNFKKELETKNVKFIRLRYFIKIDPYLRRDFFVHGKCLVMGDNVLFDVENYQTYKSCTVTVPFKDIIYYEFMEKSSTEK